MTIEILYPELGNLFGDMANARYLQACAPDAQFHFTDVRSTPYFVQHDVDMIYIGSMSEPKQVTAVQKLMPHRDRLKELIERGVVVLATGNATELFGQYILDTAANAGRKTPMLGLFPYYADRKIQEIRHNSMFLGDFEDIKMVGCRAQFSFIRGTLDHPFITLRGGCGNSPEDKTEGIHYKNFFATYLLGPLLVLNPLFTKYLLRLLGHDDALAFELQAMEAYRFRLEQLEDPKANFHIG